MTPRRAAISCGALLALSLAAWSPGLDGPFQFDDYATPLNDPASHSLAAWVDQLSVTLRPVTKLTYAMEASAGLEREVAVRRAVSISLHGVAATLLLLLVARLEPRLRWRGAFFVAALWMVHPVHADSVMSLSGRSALLSGLFLIGALLAMEARRPMLAATVFVLACLSRETALAGLLPLAVLALAPSDEPRRRRLLALTPVVTGAAAAFVWCVTTPRYLQLAEYSFLGRPMLRSLWMQVGAVPVGLGLLARPSSLSADYGLALPTGPADPLFLLGAFLYLAAGIGVVVLARVARTTALGLALWLAALLPTQSLIPKLDALANRPLGLALAGLLVASLPACSWAAARATPVLRAIPRERLVACAAVLLLGLPLGALAFSARARSALYESELTLWEDAAAKSRTNARPHAVYATLLRNQGRDREAIAAISAAREIDPFDSGIAAIWSVLRNREEEP